MSRASRRKQRAAQVAASKGSAPPETAGSGGSPSSAAVSDRIVVNRANALHSTGPRTPEGKARSRANALTHGLYARTLAASADALGEDLAAFEALHESLVAEYAPEGSQEEHMVGRLALLRWRLDRLSAFAQQELVASLAAGADTLDALLGSERVATAEARLERAISRLHRDLLFLARYRQRTAHDDAKRRSAHAVDRLLAESAAEEERMFRYIRAKRMAGRPGAAMQASPEGEPVPQQAPVDPAPTLTTAKAPGDESPNQTAA